MELGGRIYVSMPSRRDDVKFSIWNISDIHYGNRACALELLKKDIERIKRDPFAFWFGGGDYADFIGYTDKRFHPDSVAPNIRVKDLGNLGKVLTDGVVELLNPIKNKCLGIIKGNHEATYARHKEQEDLQSYMAIQLGTRPLGYCAFADVVFTHSKGDPKILPGPIEDNTRASAAFRFFLHHGAGYATTEGGKLNRLIRFMERFEADVYMCGHVHDQTGKRIQVLRANTNCTDVIHGDRVGIITGGYLRAYAKGTTTYAEMRGYLPTVLGAANVDIWPNTREIRGNF